MFNNKKDVLLESVKKVMQESELHRKLEAELNEAYGIASRAALPHEYVAEYDAILEGIKNGEETIEQLNKRMSNAAKKPGPTVDAPTDEANNSKRDDRAKLRKYFDRKKIDEAKNNLSDDQKKLAALGTVAFGKGNENEIDKHDLGAARKGHAHKVDLEEKATEAQKAKIAKVMHKWKQGKEHIGKSEKTVPVTKEGQKQAVAIALSQAGLSKKKRMDESLEAIHEEIRNTLWEKLDYVYENYGKEAAMEMYASLTEEEQAILETVDTAPARYQGSKGVKGTRVDPYEGGNIAFARPSRTSPPAATPAAPNGKNLQTGSFTNTASSGAPNPSPSPLPTGRSYMKGPGGIQNQQTTPATPAERGFDRSSMQQQERDVERKPIIAASAAQFGGQAASPTATTAAPKSETPPARQPPATPARQPAARPAPSSSDGGAIQNKQTPWGDIWGANVGN